MTRSFLLFLLALSTALAGCVHYSGKPYSVPAGPWQPPASDGQLYAELAHDQPELVPDEKLARVAKLLAKRASRDGGEHLNQDVTRRLLWLEGVIDPDPATYSGPLNELSLPRGLRQAVVRDMAMFQYNRVGLGRVPRMYGGELVVVVATRECVHLDAPVPQEASRDAFVRLSGELIAPLRHPLLVITTPSGKVYRRTFSTEREFDHRFVFREQGVFQVELVGSDPVRGPKVAANFPIYVESSPENPWSGWRLKKPSSAPTQEVEKTLLEWINRDRQAAGFDPLVSNEAVATVARAHSVEMVTDKYFAHVSLRHGTPTDRLRRAGIDFARSAENISKHNSVEATHEGLMGSPGHRGAILMEDANQIGIGAAYDARGWLMITEDFILVADPIDQLTDAKLLFKSIFQLRARSGRQPFVLDPTLTSIAEAVTAHAADRTDEELVQDLRQGLSSAQLPYARTHVQVGRLVRVRDLAKLTPMSRQDLGAIGFAVTKQSKTILPNGAVRIVIAYGSGEQVGGTPTN